MRRRPRFRGTWLAAAASACVAASCRSSVGPTGHDAEALEHQATSHDAALVEQPATTSDAAIVEGAVRPPLALTVQNQPLLPRFEVAKKSGRYAIIETDPKRRWTRDCSVYRTCNVQARELSPCTEGATPPTWSEIAPRASRFEGQIIGVRAPLVVGGGGGYTKIGCPSTNECCNHGYTSIALLGYPSLLVLKDHSCRGDKSRICCSSPAYGQTVQATGRLARATLGRELWMLKDVRLCLDPSDAGAL